MGLKPLSGKIESQEINNNFSYLQSLMANFSGGPSGSFGTLAELKAKYPKGYDGFFIVENDEGRAYFWDGKAWIRGNIYQAVGLADKSATTAKRTVLGEFGTLSLSGVPNINTKTKELEIGNYYAIPVYRNKTMGENLKNTNITIGTERTGNFIAIDLESETIVMKNGMGNFTENEIYLGYCFWDTKQFSFPFEFTVDGEAILPKNSLTIKHAQPSLLQGTLLTTQKILIDNVTKSIKFPPAGVVFFLCGDRQIDVGKYLNTKMDLSARNGNYMVFDVSTNEILSINSVASITNNQVFFGYINFGNNFVVDLKANYTTLNNGVTSDPITKKWLNKTFQALGDSITYGDNGVGTGGNAVSWVVHVAKMLGVQAVNVGKNGSTFIKRSTRTDSFVERCVTIKDADLITIWGGVNDFHSGSPIDAFKDAVDLVILTLIKNNPNSKLLLLTPTKTTKFVPSFSENSQGLTQLAYVDVLKTVADYYSIPVLDMYTNANLTPFVEELADVYMKDRLHPTNAGYVRISPQIASALEQL